jgi:hypothetical protein
MTPGQLGSPDINLSGRPQNLVTKAYMTKNYQYTELESPNSTGQSQWIQEALDHIWT